MVQRYISSSFWSDDWVDSLNCREKLLYLHLLTNECTNIAGVYRITIKRIKDDTGISREEVVEILEKFKSAGKAFYYQEYMIIPKWIKHQKIESRPKIKLGIQSILKALPIDVLNFLSQKGHYYYDVSSFIKLKIPCAGSGIPYRENAAESDMVSIPCAGSGIPYRENAAESDMVSIPCAGSGIPYRENAAESDMVSIPCAGSGIPYRENAAESDMISIPCAGSGIPYRENAAESDMISHDLDPDLDLDLNNKTVTHTGNIKDRLKNTEKDKKTDKPVCDFDNSLSNLQKEYGQKIFEIFHAADLPGGGNIISFLQQDFRLGLEEIQSLHLHSTDVILACKNYASVIRMRKEGSTWWNSRQGFYELCRSKNIIKFLPDRFTAGDYLKARSPPSENRLKIRSDSKIPDMLF